MKISFKFLILSLTLSLTFAANGQTPKPIDYFSALKNIDLSKLWRADSIYIEGGPEKNSESNKGKKD